ncbi:hypothetical protein H8S33_15325 [Ornithinibacillus sp. BX22]|uniref:Uncharacterized protein n=1 Tax=Ornithinibacillus hominis TaxID=2763055 RepID=A0A923RJQ8_9BACI|nr:hypothetical protein [Ornithinibacillus hominis]MBC5638166.1 hypothetical protein [Ornithinibacillus hominis]
MLLTPLGPIKLYVDDEEIEYKAIRYIVDKRCRDANGRYLIEYKYKKEYKAQKIKCCIPSLRIEGDIESGERLEAISFYKEFTKLTIGVEADFALAEEYGYDFSGGYVDNGIEYETNSCTEDRTFKFGISWIQPYTEENDHQTWYAADPAYMPTTPIKAPILSIDELGIWEKILWDITDKMNRMFTYYINVGLNYKQFPLKIVVIVTSIEETVHKKEINSIIRNITDRYEIPNHEYYEIVYQESGRG